MTKITIVFLFFFNCIISLQSQHIELQGSVYNTTNTPLLNCNITVRNATSNKTICYLNTGDQNIFSIKLKWNKQDTLFIEASYSGFEKKIITLIVNKADVYNLNFNLEIAVKKDDEVTIIANKPTWKNGDTTFFKVDLYKEPVQRKLGEVIAKLPGFRIDANGNLLFKNKIIQSITIDGEELFADKINLLLKNIPLHVINTIQALENQNSNTKLKGLFGDDEVTVNIGLKKDKLNALFGDAEAGIGTKKRYLANPVIFKLLKAFKIALISDNNNYGKSLDYIENYQLKGRLYTETESGNINNYGIFIPNFNTSRYYNNQFFDNRLQINFPLGKKIKSKTEFTYIKDKQQQLSNAVSSIYSDTAFFDRTTFQKIVNAPQFFQLSQKIEWDINKKNSLVFSLVLNKDKKSFEEDNIITQNNKILNNITTVENNWTSFVLKLNYNKRINDKKAFIFESSMGSFNFPQFIIGQSASWKDAFALPDTAYKLLNQNYINKATFIKAKATSYIKIKKRVYSYYINGEWRNVNLQSNLYFKTPFATLQPIDFVQLSSNGLYQQGTLNSSFGYGFKAFKIPFLLSSEIGLIKTIIKEQNKIKSFINPLLQISLKQDHKFNQNANSNFDISYQTNTQELYKLHNNIYPNGVVQFSNNINANIPQKSLSVHHSIYFNFKYSNLHFSQYFSQYFSAHLNQPSITGFVNFNTDSVINTNLSNTYSISGGYTFPFVLLASKVSLNYRSSIFNGIILNNERVAKSTSYNTEVNIEIKRNWNKKIFLTTNSKLLSFKVQLPLALQSQSFKPTLNLVNTLSLKGTISKTIASTIIVEHILNNFTSNSKTKGLFTDVELVKSFTKSKLSLRFKFENIFNQKQYLLVDRFSALNQNLYTVPLIGRNVFLAIRLEL